MGPLAMRDRMVDQCSRTTSSRSVDRASGKRSHSGDLMGSSSSEWRVLVLSHFDRFDKGGSTHVCLLRRS